MVKLFSCISLSYNVMRFEAKLSLLRFAFEKWMYILQTNPTCFVCASSWVQLWECGYKHCKWSSESNACLKGIVLKNDTIHFTNLSVGIPYWRFWHTVWFWLIVWRSRATIIGVNRSRKCCHDLQIYGICVIASFNGLRNIRLTFNIFWMLKHKCMRKENAFFSLYW